MIELFIFHLHIIGSLYAFTKNWQNRSFKEGFLALMVIGVFFSIGWALTGAIAGVIWPSKLNSQYFTRDTLSLVLLLIPEYFFFKYFFLRDKIEVSES
ncbi:MAG: hypothetical protein NT007_12110 [Candidatus Kapabacteria bacterium]|nr:hypothetical protein [Candidatus Kapabacteria bacterium]